MSKKDATTDKLTLPAQPAALTFRIVGELYDPATGKAYKSGDEARLLEEKAEVIGAIAFWVRNGDIAGAFPGMEHISADQRVTQPGTPQS